MRICHPVTGTDWRAGHDGLIAPAANPLRGKFGLTRNGGTKQHNGVDLSTYHGQAIFAAHDGVIARAGLQTNTIGRQVNEGYGLRVYIKEGELTTIYAHLSGILVKPNHRVYAGQLIGWAGETGNATGEDPHCHFGVRIDGKWVDPLLWSVGDVADDS